MRGAAHSHCWHTQSLSAQPWQIHFLRGRHSLSALSFHPHSLSALSFHPHSAEFSPSQMQNSIVDSKTCGDCEASLSMSKIRTREGCRTTRMASKKRMLERNASRGPQGTRRTNEERGMSPANGSGQALAPVPHPPAAKKPHKALCENQRQGSRFKDCGSSGLCEH